MLEWWTRSAGSIEKRAKDDVDRWIWRSRKWEMLEFCLSRCPEDALRNHCRSWENVCIDCWSIEQFRFLKHFRAAEKRGSNVSRFATVETNCSSTGIEYLQSLRCIMRTANDIQFAHFDQFQSGCRCYRRKDRYLIAIGSGKIDWHRSFR